MTMMGRTDILAESGVCLGSLPLMRVNNREYKIHG